MNNIWLRDLCRCSFCWIADSSVKKRVNLINIPMDIRCVQGEIRKNSLFVSCKLRVSYIVYVVIIKNTHTLQGVMAMNRNILYISCIVTPITNNTTDK